MYLIKKIQNSIIFIIIVLLFLNIGQIKVISQELILDSDIINLYPDSEKRFVGSFSEEKFSEEKSEGVKLPTSLRKILPNAQILVTVKQVTPISGNNPLNPKNPILNYNNQVVSSVQQLVELMQTGGGGEQGGEGSGQTTGCVGQTVEAGVIIFDCSIGNPPTNFCVSIIPGISVEINPNTGICSIRQDTTGKTLGMHVGIVYTYQIAASSCFNDPVKCPAIIDIKNSIGDSLYAYTDSEGSWNFIPPTQTQGECPYCSVKVNFGTPTVVYLKETTTGMKVKITFTAQVITKQVTVETPRGEQTPNLPWFQLTINSIEKIQ